MLTTETGFVYNPGANNIHDTYGIILLWVFTIIAILFIVYSNYWMFHSEYKKDPNFINRPTALIWKIPLLIGCSPFVAGFPFLAHLLIQLVDIFLVPHHQCYIVCIRDIDSPPHPQILLDLCNKPVTSLIGKK